MARFKAATDAVFAQRKAASAALEAELATNLATREALLDRLSALRVDTPVAEIERALAEVDRAWRQSGDVPRGASEVIEGRFREARPAAAERLKAAAREGWQAQCDALAARLALCEERETANGSIADFSQRWAAQAALPATWDRTLTLRCAQPGESGPLAEAAVDELLLQLETALDLPIAPERQAERRNLKLRALKDSMEGRATPDDGPAQQAEWLLAMLRQSGSFLEDLARRVAIQSVSQVPENRPHLAQYLEGEIAPAFERIGFQVQVIENPEPRGGPLLLAERIEDPSLPTVLSYGHGDVIRGLDGLWRGGLAPWTIKQEGDRLYGRGTADNKGQHSINMAGLAAVIAERGRLGFNAKFLIETGEETGSPGLQQFCRENRPRLAADVFIASDGPRLSARPTLYLRSRGGLNFTLAVELREGSHHSGNWGGLLANPAVILAHAQGSIISRDGQVLAREILPGGIPPSVKRALADCEPEGGEGGPRIDDWWGEPGLTAAEKVFVEDVRNPCAA